MLCILQGVGYMRLEACGVIYRGRWGVGGQQWINRGGLGVERQLVVCLGGILHEWVPTQDLPVVLIVIQAA